MLTEVLRNFSQKNCTFLFSGFAKKSGSVGSSSGGNGSGSSVGPSSASTDEAIIKPTDPFNEDLVSQLVTLGFSRSDVSSTHLSEFRYFMKPIDLKNRIPAE